MSALLYGFNPAFYGGPNGILSRQEDQQLIKNDLLQLLLTVPGERVFRPTFGTILRSSIFEQLDSRQILAIRDSISESIKTHEPRVNVVKLNLTATDNTNELRIFLVAQIKVSPNLYITIDRLVSGG
jgi:phage baseplate assembly protein W